MIQITMYFLNNQKVQNVTIIWDKAVQNATIILGQSSPEYKAYPKNLPKIYKTSKN